jgi:hypothetical protein
MYPGSEERYTITELEILVETKAAVPMMDLAQFGKYHRQFITRANWLLVNTKISQRECSKMFLDGLHVDFRNQVKGQLRLMDPMHPFDRPWSFSQIEEAAKFLLEGSYGQTAVAYPTAHPSYNFLS